MASLPQQLNQLAQVRAPLASALSRGESDLLRATEPIMPCMCVCFVSSNLQSHIPQHLVLIWFCSSLRPSNLLPFKDVLISLTLTGLSPAPVGRGRFQLASHSPAANALAQALSPDV